MAGEGTVEVTVCLAHAPGGGLTLLSSKTGAHHGETDPILSILVCFIPVLVKLQK